MASIDTGKHNMIDEHVEVAAKTQQTLRFELSTVSVFTQHV